MSHTATTKRRSSRRPFTHTHSAIGTPGQRPGALHPLVVALATAFLTQSAAHAQPVGPQAVAGQATVQTQGSNLLVTTQNAPGTQHSTINWQSFNVGSQASVQFVQPSASSSILNRVAQGEA